MISKATVYFFCKKISSLILILFAYLRIRGFLVMAWRGKGKGSSDVIKRGSAFRPAVSSDSYDPFPDSHPVLECEPLDSKTEALINAQRLLVNHLLNPGEETLMRVHLSTTTAAGQDSSFSKQELWKQLAKDIGPEFYPAELMTDSRSVLFGVQHKKKSSPKKNPKTSLAALESSENKGGEEETHSPRSQVEESQDSDDSVGGDDYNIGLDFEDEGARDDYDEGGDEGGGDYGGEI